MKTSDTNQGSRFIVAAIRVFCIGLIMSIVVMLLEKTHCICTSFGGAIASLSSFVAALVFLAGLCVLVGEAIGRCGRRSPSDVEDQSESDAEDAKTRAFVAALLRAQAQEAQLNVQQPAQDNSVTRADDDATRGTP